MNAKNWLDENKDQIFFDVNNGRSRPMTATQVFEQVTGNPCYYEDSEEPFYYTTFLGEELSYSVQELVEIFGIALENKETKENS